MLRPVLRHRGNPSAGRRFIRGGVLSDHGSPSLCDSGGPTGTLVILLPERAAPVKNKCRTQAISYTIAGQFKVRAIGEIDPKKYRNCGKHVTHNCAALDAGVADVN